MMPLKIFRYISKTFIYLIIAAFALSVYGYNYDTVEVKAPSPSEKFLFESRHTTCIYINQNEKPVVQTALSLLQKDVETVFDAALQVSGDKNKIRIIAGTIGQNEEISRLANSHTIDLSAIEGKWEAFLFAAVTENGRNLLVIAGSDSRGTAYGLLELSRMIGVSPWHYFADLAPCKATSFPLPQLNICQLPSVRYRGIFLNDEDWGLMPWATQTLVPESEKGAIGPEAYEKIFELLLRLRANTIWPAMHECTVSFYTVKGNKEMAGKYGIVAGTSHCEPMMRCSASEWDIAGQGDYNYTTNKAAILSYWTERLQELTASDNIYTIGMRGKHDGIMQGVRTIDEHKFYLTQIIRDQQELLRKFVHPDPSQLPQVFIPYKEVLDVYDAGLEVPDYVTLVWCDDNYGYIRRLSNEKEQLRPGGSGIYYHVSYWGRPHDYLWLASTSPALIYTEMKRAYEYGARQLWILNVGDIKPAEYLMEFFLDMAWNIRFCEQNGKETSVFKHLQHWAAREFGEQQAPEITSVMKEYYRLANIRKPEHTGWNRVEEQGYPKGLTPVTDSEYNPEFNNELQNRIRDYQAIEEQVMRIQTQIPDNKKSAFFQLVAYPVRGASLINQKWLYAQLAHYYTDKEIEKARIHARQSLQAYDEIEAISNDYARMENGKWNRMMDFKPRRLPVFDKPVFNFPDSVSLSSVPCSPVKPDKRIVHVQNARQAIKGLEHGKIIEGLGHSFAAVQMQQGDSLSFVFNVGEPGEGFIRIAAIPNHDVDGQGMKIAVSVDGQMLPPADYSVEGRSEAWKQNVLRGQVVVSFPCAFRQRGPVSISVKALTPYIILDQIMIEPYDNRIFYEFPTITNNHSADCTDLIGKKSVKICGQKHINHEYISFFQ
ncbi:MAG: glycosyl hydrolase 115 family protein [Dysgonamonadaceae bacterium]|nr:glycosyl hydrolase 115 family protein [Dysgonamonadaceae bacterium]